MCAGFPSPKDRIVTGTSLHMKVNGLGKFLGAAVVADVLLNDGKGVRNAAPGCGCYAIFLLILFISPFVWLYMKIFH